MIDLYFYLLLQLQHFSKSYYNRLSNATHVKMNLKLSLNWPFEIKMSKVIHCISTGSWPIKGEIVLIKCLHTFHKICLDRVTVFTHDLSPNSYTSYDFSVVHYIERKSLEIHTWLNGQLARPVIIVKRQSTCFYFKKGNILFLLSGM